MVSKVRPDGVHVGRVVILGILKGEHTLGGRWHVVHRIPTVIEATTDDQSDLLAARTYVAGLPW